jgi:hypothetical protein
MKNIILFALILLLSASLFGCTKVKNEAPVKEEIQQAGKIDDEVAVGAYEETDSIAYENTQYGFSFSLPESWKGYTIVTDKWEGLAPGDSQVAETGAVINIRHPQWSSEDPRQDIPIMILTLAQWNSLQQEKFYIGAAPIGPSELGRNSEYVFMLPARYNYAFPTGFEAVENILNSSPSPLQPK